MQTPSRNPRETEPTISVQKIYARTGSDIFNTQVQGIEETPKPADQDFAFPRIRGYDIISIVGSGGMGIVYEARHRELNRRVAIKTLRGEVLASAESRERFRAEAEAIAKLQHPHIIQVFEVGTLESQPGDSRAHPFIALEYVDGGSLTERTRTPQPPAQAARTVETLARAAHAAHLLGIVHRDLKPANVLLTGDGAPKIADFGIAKRLDSPTGENSRQLTRAGSVMGTPEYMAPEQFNEGTLSPSIDIYALGVILYELLTARVPFQGASFADTMMLTMHQDPVPPRRLRPDIPRDLEVICLKCLEKAPSRRYQTAEALAEDLARFAEGRTIQARPVGAIERTSRWAKRNPAVAALAFLLVLVGIAGIAGVAWNWNEARLKADEARLAARDAFEASKNERWERYRVCVVAASSQLRLDDSIGARRALDDAPEEHRDWVWKLLHARLDKAHTVLQGREFPLIGYTLSDDGRWVMLRGNDHTLRLWDTTARSEYEPVRGTDVYARCPVLSRDGKLLAYVTPEHTIRICEALTGRIITNLEGHARKVCQLEFSHDGSRLISLAHDATLRIWDVAGGQPLRVFEHGSTDGGSFQLSANPGILAYTTYRSTKACLLDMDSLRVLAVMPNHPECVRFLRFSPAGDRLATIESFPKNIIRLWDVPSGKLIATLRGHSNQIVTVRFSADGKYLASCSLDRTVRIWDNSAEMANPEPGARLVLKGHTGWVNSIAFSPSGERLVSTAQDATLRYWDLKSGDQIAVLRGHAGMVEAAAFTPDGSTIVSAGSEGAIRLWDTREMERDQAIIGHGKFVYGAAFHPDGERVASASWDGTARIWNATTGIQLMSFDHKNQIVASVAYHPSGRFLATIARDDKARLWDADAGTLLHEWTVPANDWRDSRVAFSPGGELLAAGAHDGRVRLWNVNTRKEYAVLEKHNDGIRDLAFSPDGRWLASAGETNDRSIRIWDIAAKNQIQVLKGHTDCIYSLAWSHSGKLLASGSIDGTVRLWDTSSWSEIGCLKPSVWVHGLSFAPGDKLLAAACADNLIRLWDVKTRQEIAELSGHTDYVHALAFSADGTRLVSASGDRTLRVWDSLSPLERAKK